MEMKEDELLQPVSPTAQHMNSSVQSISLIVVLELEMAIDELQFMSFAKHFIHLNPLFTSIMVNDVNGERKWKEVEVNIEEHIIVHTPPSNLSLQLFDAYFNEYMTNYALQELPQNKPLWEIHIINCPTSNAAGNLVFKIRHSLGDGYSFMGLLISGMTRAHNPSLPLTFPSRTIKAEQSGHILGRVSQFLLSSMNTVLDFGWNIMKSSVLEDHLTPIRSGRDDVEFRTFAIRTITFSLPQIKQIKTKLGETINDVITGMIFLGLRLYMQETRPDSTNSNSTALVLINTRMIGNYKSLQDMLKANNSNTSWGNRFGFLHIDIPKATEYELSNPLQFIKAAQEMIKRKRYSSAVYLVDKVMEMIHKLRGPEVAAKLMYKTFRNTSLVISNMIGPREKMAVCGHPVKGVYFTVVGVAQSLVITMISYMDDLRITFRSEKEFIDEVKLTSCMNKAFENIYKASMEVSI
ncbi:O-acyltransferase WSD1-like [Cucurbita moschata]|uniref:O-acyltransferase WSD1-like n=1 Tax=Cucurbita moschata TaxID=3662 RepID=A0A6J1GJA7_CUCMO|nr:O-acyltransferase WSD1-like [Cucurbita moschata]